MKKHVLSVLVENHSGVLSRVANLFSRRGFNIHSLSVGETENPTVSCMTIVTGGDDRVINQIKKQLNKLIDVIEIAELDADKSIYRELALIKVVASPVLKSEIIQLVDIFRAKIVDVSTKMLSIEITGDEQKISAFIEMMMPYGIKKMVRTGITALQRGE